MMCARFRKAPRIVSFWIPAPPIHRVRAARAPRVMVDHLANPPRTSLSGTPLVSPEQSPCGPCMKPSKAPTGHKSSPLGLKPQIGRDTSELQSPDHLVCRLLL